MSLATRCTACGTVFRVVQDQLRVSEGWVRCGRCTEVFNAVENLVDPPLTAAGAAHAASAASISPGTGAPAAMARMGSASPGPGSGHPAQDERIDIELDVNSELDVDRNHDHDRTHDRDDQHLRSGFAAEPDASTADVDARYGASSLLPSGFEPSEPPAAAAATTTATAAAASAADATAGQALPSFVRQADRAARWQQPRVRAGLAALVLLGALGLLGQAAFSYRDLLAARWPAAQPLLAQACAALGCTVQAPRLIDALVVDSSGLVRVERSSVYRLSVTLRNQDALTVALPALDLTLTDTQGRLVSRRVLRLEELGQTQTSLAAGAELVLQATLQTPQAEPGAAVSGYTIDLFYP